MLDVHGEWTRDTCKYRQSIQYLQFNCHFCRIRFEMLKLLCSLVITAFGLAAVRADQESRIFGGQDAVIGQFPHNVRVRSIRDNNLFCGGSIIADRFVLTSPQCVEQDIVRDLRVVVGEIDIEDNGTEYHVDMVEIHPEATWAENDIAVVRVSEPFQFSANVRAIRLPTEDTPIMNDGLAVPATIVGWGYSVS